MHSFERFGCRKAKDQRSKSPKMDPQPSSLALSKGLLTRVIAPSERFPKNGLDPPPVLVSLVSRTSPECIRWSALDVGTPQNKDQNVQKSSLALSKRFYDHAVSPSERFPRNGLPPSARYDMNTRFFQAGYASQRPLLELNEESDSDVSDPSNACPSRRQNFPILLSARSTPRLPTPHPMKSFVDMGLGPTFANEEEEEEERDWTFRNPGPRLCLELEFSRFRKLISIPPFFSVIHLAIVGLGGLHIELRVPSVSWPNVIILGVILTLTFWTSSSLLSSVLQPPLLNLRLQPQFAFDYAHDVITFFNTISSTRASVYNCI
ncbi:hypothetical protein GALMADRAFT_147711 [Galerina marginata CBS 339.88]|uniref:Uncharacterized protein n=1 Tax=Galerina marginata (strain CBS 339.88) TaxID=685588 RepID=A0A067S731_GALM3|nr:hypothetical protein GALMADRAFT_147711 [Galerina marginata CBS 339.88]